MSYIESSLRVRRSIAKLTDTDADDWFLCMKARFGLAEVYRAIHDTLGAGAILTTPYTCITSINPILVADLTPSYLILPTVCYASPAIPPKHHLPTSRFTHSVSKKSSMAPSSAAQSI